MAEYLIEDGLVEDGESLSYNDSDAQYVTESSGRGVPRYEEVQIRFNNILQKRIQLDENLTGSQIAYILDYYVDRCFDILDWLPSTPELMESLQKEYLRTIQTFIKNRRKLFSIRYSNEEVLDVLVELFFEKDIKVFKERFLNMKLNREVYLDYLDSVFKPSVIADVDALDYFSFYRKQYTEFKNLLLGNYIRFSFSETNKFFSYYKDKTTLEAKEDYFSGLMIVILRVIDKYDSFKGTLTSFIENWFKDYRTTFKARQRMIDGSVDIEDEGTLHQCSLGGESIEDAASREAPFKKQMLENLLAIAEMRLDEFKTLIKSNQKHFPNISLFLEE